MSKPKSTGTIQEIERQPVVAIDVPSGHSELQDQLHDLKVRLGRLETSVGECVDVLAGIQLLASDAEMSLTTMPNRKQSGSIRHGELVVDRRQFTVTDGTKVCFLGDTTRFRLFEHLARRPNRYFTYSELLDSVWEGANRSDATIRRAVFDLRNQFRRARMDRLGDAIRSQGRTYGLILDDSLR